ncbi:FG-GAP repeat domain-containing protein [Streptomyces sp. NPDC003327]
MPHARSTRRRLSAAVTTVLAVTLGAGVLAAPAHAGVPTAVNAAPSAAAEEPTLQIAPDTTLLAAGVDRYLTKSTSGITGTRPYSGATGTGFSGRVEMRSTHDSDFVIHVSSTQITQRNYRTSGSFEIAVGSFAGRTYVGSASHALFTTSQTEAGTRLVQWYEVDNVTHADTVTGLPAGATEIAVTQGTPEHALITFKDGTTAKWGLVDLATATVGEIHDRAPDAVGGDIAVSGTHVAWTTGDGTGTPGVSLLDRATGSVQEIPVEDALSDDLQVGLVGGWVVYGEGGGGQATAPHALHALTAYDPATKASRKLLDHVVTAVAAPDGSLHVRGGLVGRGEGIYKITADAIGQLVTAFVVTANEPTEVAVTGTAPTTVDLDANGGTADFGWALSRTNVEAKLTIRHTRTGLTRELVANQPGTKDLKLTWGGDLGPDAADAHNGAYTWQLTATPLNGIGPAATATGDFTVTRKTQPHDFDDNGSADALFRDASGNLWRHDTTYRGPDPQLQAQPRKLIGSGWAIYNSIEATGDLGGSAVGDLLARDTSGGLFLYQGNGQGGFAPRVKVGTGWGIYKHIAAGSDLDGDGRADLVATDSAGALWFYKGTGSVTAPLAARKQIGTGWGIYNQLAAVGDIAGATAGDLVARDAAGVLWLYLGKGDGTFASRVRIGGGWNAYSHLVGVGDVDGDGRSDLVGYGAAGDEYLHRGTGSWSAPFAPRQLAALTRADQPYNHTA